MWDPQQYELFEEERKRPFFDLVGRIRTKPTNRVVDLGCGTGELTGFLAERWPEAETIGVDSSPEMLERANANVSARNCRFDLADVADWQPDGPVDAIVSNAALHWLPDHQELIPRLVNYLAPGGSLAVQMPYRFATPSQDAIDAASSDPRWAETLSGVGLHRGSVHPLDWYAALLTDLDCTVDAWETTYLHVLSGENPVFEWLKGSGLRPLLSALDDERREAFSADVAARLRAAYPPHGDVTFFPMPRVFFVAQKK